LKTPKPNMLLLVVQRGENHGEWAVGRKIVSLPPRGKKGGGVDPKTRYGALPGKKTKSEAHTRKKKKGTIVKKRGNGERTVRGKRIGIMNRKNKPGM